MNNRILTTLLLFSSLYADSIILPDFNKLPSLTGLRKSEQTPITKPEVQKLATNTSNKIYLSDLMKILNENYNLPELLNKRVSISLKNASIEDAIELVGKSTGINFVIDSDVSGKVKNINLKDVPVSYALKALLSNNNPELALKKEMGIYRILRLNKAINSLRYVYQEINQGNYEKSVITLQNVNFTDEVKSRIKRMWRGVTGEEYRRNGI